MQNFLNFGVLSNVFSNRVRVLEKLINITKHFSQCENNQIYVDQLFLMKSIKYNNSMTSVDGDRSLEEGDQVHFVRQKCEIWFHPSYNFSNVHTVNLLLKITASLLFLIRFALSP